MQHRKALIQDLDVKAFEKGLRYIDNKKPEKAIQLFKKVLAKTDIKEAWLNMGVAYKWVNDYDKVKECFLKSCEKDVPLSDGTYIGMWDTATINLGLLAYTFEQDDVALQFYKTVLEKDPLNYEAIWNTSIASLRQYCSRKRTDLDKCWEYYSYRFKRKNAEMLKNDKYVNLWDFKTVHPNDSIIVLIEQGMGDAIMFARYLPILKTFFKDVYVQCAPELDWIFRDYNKCRAGSETDAVYAIPMASLGKIANYIPSGEWLADRFVPKVADGELSIGVVWKGNPDHPNDRNRSVNPYFFNRFKKYGTLYTLGPGPKFAGFKHLEGKTWEDTAANLSKLDLVISVDTSIVHFCGALGMPCWVLLPTYDTDFRWGDSSMGYDNLWYSSVDVIRNPHSWEKTFDAVEARLQNVRSQ